MMKSLCCSDSKFIPTLNHLPLKITKQFMKPQILISIAATNNKNNPNILIGFNSVCVKYNIANVYDTNIITSYNRAS